ncbi:MAG: hypothetical protein ACXVA9_12995 [Bdellovibrionales bacterium]
MTNKLIFSLALISFMTLAACAGVDSETKTTNTTVSGGSNPAAGTSSSSSSITKRYQFNINGCDTGEHIITTSSEEETAKQYCQTLRDNSANNGCAEGFRRASFKIECPGMSWE